MFARTERLLLRPAWREDAPALHRAIGEEAVIRNLARAPWPYGERDAAAFIDRDADGLLPNFLIFARTDAAPVLVGGVGLHREEAGAPGESGAVELGYWISRAHWGRGFATEAGRAVLEIADSCLRLRRITAGHFLDNPASGRVLRKLGFRPTGCVVHRHSLGRGTSAPCALFERESEALSARGDRRPLAA